MNQFQAAELTHLIKLYAAAYSAVDRAEGSSVHNERTAADNFIAAQTDLANLISQLTEYSK
jgi:hypothetical protein